MTTDPPPLKDKAVADNANRSSNAKAQTQTCKVCGRELPVSGYRKVTGGGLSKTCRECTRSKMRQTLAAKRAALEAPYSDPEFDGKDPREVVDTMIRCRRWLEHKGFTIELSCKYTEIKVHTINCK